MSTPDWRAAGQTTKLMAVISILEAAVSPQESGRLIGCEIDAPTEGSSLDEYSITIIGWALGRTCPVAMLEVLHEGVSLWRSPVDQKRPDIAMAFPDVGYAERSGFRLRADMLHVPTEFELTLQLILEDQSLVPLGSICGSRRKLVTGDYPRLVPIMLTTLGRTGSTWLVQLLGQHPQIVAYRPFQCEPRIGSYWMQILKLLSDPDGILRPVFGFTNPTKTWWLEEPSAAMPDLLDHQLQRWLMAESVESSAIFCRDRIAEFYEMAAVALGTESPAYFVEKYLPGRTSFYFMLDDLFREVRQIFLVRDFRDMVASILAFNAKRGFIAFGREEVLTDEEYVSRVGEDAQRLLQSWKRHENGSCLVRYEDLVEDPNETLKSVLRYLEIDHDIAITRQMLRDGANLLPKAQQYHRTSVDSGQSVGRWQRDLSPSLLEACDRAFRNALEEFNYL